MKTEQEDNNTIDVWKQEATRLLRAELALSGVTLTILSKRLESCEGITISAKSLSNRIGAGSFSMAFFMQCMSVLGKKTMAIEK